MPDLANGQLSSRDFRRLAEYIQGATGIRMPPGKKTMLEGRLRRRMRDLGVGAFSEYCRFLFEENGLADEAVHLIDVVTTNKTDFFREPDHFHFLAGHGLPELVKHGWGLRRPLAVWSAASSIGAEAYSLAMLLADYARVQRGFDFSILATDICTEVLETGARGIYPEAMIEPVPMEMRRRYLRRARDRNADTVRVVPELRGHVQFSRLNLIEGPYDFDGLFEVIFCRNILIYFDRPTQQAVITHLCDHLRPGGYLFIGHSETLSGMELPFRQVATTIFQRE
ncbi:MAG: CheR family methyltransferase [Bacteroidota bacterium]